MNTFTAQKNIVSIQDVFYNQPSERRQFRIDLSNILPSGTVVDGITSEVFGCVDDAIILSDISASGQNVLFTASSGVDNSDVNIRWCVGITPTNNTTYCRNTEIRIRNR